MNKKICPFLGKKCVKEKCEFATSYDTKEIIEEKVITTDYSINIKINNIDIMHEEAKKVILSNYTSATFDEDIEIIALIFGKNSYEYNDAMEKDTVWCKIKFKYTKFITKKIVECHIKCYMGMNDWSCD